MNESVTQEKWSTMLWGSQVILRNWTDVAVTVGKVAATSDRNCYPEWPSTAGEPCVSGSHFSPRNNNRPIHVTPPIRHVAGLTDDRRGARRGPRDRRWRPTLSLRGRRQDWVAVTSPISADHTVASFCILHATGLGSGCSHWINHIHEHLHKSPSTPATMSKQHCRSNVRLCRKDEISAQNSFDIVAVFGNKVERCFDIVAGVDRA